MATTAARPVKSLMLVDTLPKAPATSLPKVLMEYFFNMIPENTANGKAPYLDTAWQDLIKKYLYNLKGLCGSGGSLDIFTNYVPPPGVSRGYNSLQDVLDRNLDPAKVLHGRAQKDYTFGCFESDLALLQSLNKDYYMAALNPSRPVLDGRKKTPKMALDFTGIYSQIDYVFSSVTAIGKKVIWIISEEAQAGANEDVIKTLDDYKAIAKPIVNYIHSKDPLAEIIGDANPSTDPTCRFDDRQNGQTMNKAMQAMEFITRLRDYCQFFGKDYSEFLTRLTEFDAQCDTFFNVNFPGKAMNLGQQQLKEGNQYENTVCQMLTIGELFMRGILQGKQGRKIFFTQSQTNGLISGTRNDLHPMLYGMSLLQDALEGEICDVSFQLINGSENLFPLAIKNGDCVYTFIRNKSDRDIVIPITRVTDIKNPDGRHWPVTVESYYGKLTDGTAAHLEPAAPGDNAICKGQSLTKITARPAAV